MSTEFSLTLVSGTSFSKTVMESPSDALMAVMSDIVDRAQQLAKNKISQLPIAQSQPMGPPTITNKVQQKGSQPGKEPSSMRSGTPMNTQAAKTAGKSDLM